MNVVTNESTLQKLLQEAIDLAPVFIMWTREKMGAKTWAQVEKEHSTSLFLIVDCDTCDKVASLFGVKEHVPTIQCIAEGAMFTLVKPSQSQMRAFVDLHAK